MSVELCVGKVSFQLQLRSSFCEVSSQHQLSYLLTKSVQCQLSSSVGKVSSRRINNRLITLVESHRLIIHAGLSSPSVLILEISLPGLIFLARTVLKGFIGL